MRRLPAPSLGSSSPPFDKCTVAGSPTAISNQKMFYWIPNSISKLSILATLDFSWTKIASQSTMTTLMGWDHSSATHLNSWETSALAPIMGMRSISLRPDASYSSL